MTNLLRLPPVCVDTFSYQNLNMVELSKRGPLHLSRVIGTATQEHVQLRVLADGTAALRSAPLPFRIPRREVSSGLRLVVAVVQ